MSACENLVNGINGAVAAAYRLNKVELKDVHKQMREIENILPPKEDQLSELYFEHKRLTQELEDLERSSLRMKSILDDLSVEELKTKNTAKITKKALKKAEHQFETRMQLTQKDKEVLFKRRLSLYIAKKFLGIHIEQGPGDELNVISWSEDSHIHSTCLQRPENNDDCLAMILWETLSGKSSSFQKWENLFEQQ